MRLLDVCWRDDAGPECAIEGSRIELCVVEGSLVSNMCAEGKDRRLDVRWRERKLGWLDVCWRECLGKLRGATLQRTPKQENGQAFPAAHIFQMQLPSSTHLFGKFQLWIARMDDYKTFPAFLLN